MAKIEKTEDLRGKALKAKDLVGYDKGAVVSRTIIQKPVGTVTIFSFDKGQGLSEHTAPFDAMVEILDGEAEIMIDRKPVKVKAGEFIIMPANRPHALHAAKKFKMALIMIKA
jgi:quercetin dioxygenase-like cupin family protein